ncbi:hypothetical protein F2P81_016656 [Scophthalmus maximus]|uniref:Uncharacterized protein n=1 Tax=Scophthalmus maximus TaxID=52904 RepID=A0A6A4SLT3_SCOMX|nr:hypothetical protein F2P81_016656 [Scophthalmus maximus]
MDVAVEPDMQLKMWLYIEDMKTYNELENRCKGGHEKFDQPYKEQIFIRCERSQSMLDFCRLSVHQLPAVTHFLPTEAIVSLHYASFGKRVSSVCVSAALNLKRLPETAPQKKDSN